MMEWRSRDGVAWLEARLDGARAAFTARGGGVSRPPYDELNLGLLSGDHRDSVLENRRRLAAALGRAPDGILFGHQVHGAEVASLSEPQPECFTGDPADGLPARDGQATAEVGLTPLVLVADCLPVALAGSRGVAMLHCGWRGLAAGIVERGVSETAATAAAIGPGIGPCCYEVGEEVLASFTSLGNGIAAGRMLDLPEVARRLLERAGVERIESASLCTCCGEERFFSHRRDAGRTGRQAGLAWVEEGVR